MKVLVVGSKYPPEYAGSGVLIHDYYKRLKQRGVLLDVEVITNSIEFPGNAKYVHDGVSVRRISSRVFSRWRELPGSFLPRSVHALKAYWEALQTFVVLMRVQCDVVHVFGMAASSSIAILWASLSKTPMVIELVTAGATPRQSLPLIKYGRFLRLNRGTAIVAISKALGEKCAAFGLIDNVWVRPNPIDEKRFFPEFGARWTLRNKHTPFGRHDRVLVMVAKFMPQKNQIFLIDVLSKLPDEYKLVLAGPLVRVGPLAARDCKYIDEIRARIKTFGLEDRVLLRTDFVDAAEYMKMSDVYMLPNTNEGLGSPMLEAMACGLPVVANIDEPPFRQWVRDGENGYLRKIKTDPWCQAIELTERFSEKSGVNASQIILNIAGSEKIDNDFLAVLENVASMPVDEPFNVKSGLVS